MTRRQGFRTLDLDVRFLYHRKMRLLQTRYPKDWPTFAAAYLAMLCESWAVGHPVSLAESWHPAIPAQMRKRTRYALRAAGLVDDTSCVPADAWLDWAGPALGRRSHALHAATRRWEARAEHESDPARAMPEHTPSNAIEPEPEPVPYRTVLNREEQGLVSSFPPPTPSSGNGTLPAENDSATAACRLLPDGGRWLGERDYVMAWDDMDRRYTSAWVQSALPEEAADLAQRNGRVRAWDLKRGVEFRLANRARAEELERQAAHQRRMEEETEQLTARRASMDAEQREQSDLMRRATRIWLETHEPVPEDLGQLRDYVAKYEGEHP